MIVPFYDKLIITKFRFFFFLFSFKLAEDIKVIHLCGIWYFNQHHEDFSFLLFSPFLAMSSLFLERLSSCRVGGCRSELVVNSVVNSQCSSFCHGGSLHDLLLWGKFVVVFPQSCCFTRLWTMTVGS